MRRLSVILALAVALLLAATGVASAAPPSSPFATASVGLPLVQVRSITIPPPGFPTDAKQAIAAAEASPVMQALHRHEHPLTILPDIWARPPAYWFIEFWYRGKLAADVNVSPAGKVTAVWTGPLANALYARGHYAPIFDSPWVVLPFSLLFLAPFLDPRRLRRMLHLDALVLLSFFVSYYLFDHAHLEAAVWLAYPPLLYLVARMIVIARRNRTRTGRAATVRLAPLLSARALGIGLLALVIARVTLSLFAPQVIDVGYASVVGAHRIASGLSPYWTGANHGDTYGPIAYLVYVPFQLVFPWHGTWDWLPSARAAAIAFDLVTILGLVALGRRLRPGGDGIRLGLALGWAWAACPFTLLGLMMHTNDGLIAMLSVLSLLVYSSSAARGAVLGLAAAAKFTPAALLPLYAGGERHGWKRALVCAATFAAVVIVSIGLYLPSGGLHEFYNETIGFQLTRSDVFSPWALHPGLDPVKTALLIVALAFAALLAFRPRERSLVEICALATAVTILVQLPAVHWFYYYIVWFMPFVLVALLARSPGQAPAGPSQRASVGVHSGEPTIDTAVLAGAI